MPIDLPPLATAGLNMVAWPALQLGVAWVFHHLDAARFDPASRWARVGTAEATFLEKVLRVKRWKDRLPDGATWFEGGFAKARLDRRDGEFLRRFARETMRGEATHWAVLCALPLFALWNPWWGMLINLLAGLVLNLPCIIAQRYNRHRLLRVVRGSGKGA